MPVTLPKSIVFALVGLACDAVCADIAVIVNSEAGISALAREELVNIYMGRLRRFPNGEAALPLDLPAGSPEKAQFYRALVNKSPAEIDAYWARLLFSGRTSPPEAVNTADRMLDKVADNANAVGYADLDAALKRLRTDKRIKIVLELPTPPMP